MIHRSQLQVCALLAAATFSSTAGAAPCESNCPAPIVFFDIAGPDAAKLRAFYSSVFNWSIDARNAIDKASAGLDGTLRQDPPEKVLYMGVPDVTAALTAIEAAGGTILAKRFEVPGVVIFGLFKDPAGNRLGLVEMEGGKVKIPATPKK
jgi:predicted enzyme related to lactoylglutathione lyase